NYQLTLNEPSYLGLERREPLFRIQLERSGAVERFERSAAVERLNSRNGIRYCRRPIRLANSAGEAMARDSGTMRALMIMSPQMAREYFLSRPKRPPRTKGPSPPAATGAPCRRPRTLPMARVPNMVLPTAPRIGTRQPKLTPNINAKGNVPETVRTSTI